MGPTKTTKSVRKTTAAPTSKTTEPARKRNLKVLSKSSINLLDSVFDEEVMKEEVTKGWVLPPSLMAVAAVPGAPVISHEDGGARGQGRDAGERRPLPAVHARACCAQG